MSGYLAQRIARLDDAFAEVDGIAGEEPLQNAVVAGRSSAFLSEHITQASMALVLPPIAALVAPAARALRGVDLSYGLYLYHMPVLNMLIFLGNFSAYGSLALAFVISALFAVLSWFFIEKPGLL